MNWLAVTGEVSLLLGALHLLRMARQRRPHVRRSHPALIAPLIAAAGLIAGGAAGLPFWLDDLLPTGSLWWGAARDFGLPVVVAAAVVVCGSTYGTPDGDAVLDHALPPNAADQFRGDSDWKEGH